MDGNNQQQNVDPLAAMMEADAEARKRDWDKADALLAQVPEALKADQYDRAVDLCSQALSLKSAHVDEKDPELADLYYEYGRCLLTKAQKRSDVFGDRAQKKIEEKEQEAAENEPANQNEDEDDEPMDQDEGDEEEGDEEGDEEEDDAEDDGQAEQEHQPQGSSSSSAAGQAASVSNDQADETKGPLTEEQKLALMQQAKITDIVEGKEDDQVEADAVPLATEEKKKEAPQQNAEAKATENEGEQQPDDLELAWDVLEVARVLYEQSGRKTRVADVHMALGEISMEGDNMESAVEEFQKCVDLRKKIQASDARALAEAHFFLALAYEHSTDAARGAPQQAQGTDPADIMSAVIQAASAFDAEKYKEFAEKAIVNLKEARRILEEELRRGEQENRAKDVEDLPPIIQEISAKIEVIETSAPTEAEMQEPAPQTQAPAFSFPSFNFGNEFGSGPAAAPPTDFDITSFIPGANKSQHTPKEFKLNLDAHQNQSPQSSAAPVPQFTKFELPSNVSFSWTPPSASTAPTASSSSSTFAAPTTTPGFSSFGAVPVVSGGSKKRVTPTVITPTPVQNSDEDSGAGGLKRKADDVSGGLESAETPSKKPNLGQ